MRELTTIERELDHNHECVGCGEHVADPCSPTCPFETGQVTADVVLRSAAGHLAEHPAGIGTSVGSAIFAAALRLTDTPTADGLAATELTATARTVLGTYLLPQVTGPMSVDELIALLGIASVDQIALALYAAAALYAGDDYDIDTFGDFDQR